MFDGNYDDSLNDSLNSSNYNYDSITGREIDLPSTKGWCHRYFDRISQGSLRGATAALFALTMSPSCLMFPYIIYLIGVYPTVGLFIFIFGSHLLSLHILKASSLKSSKNNYISLISSKLGTTAEHIYITVDLITSLGLFVAYLSICYDLLESFVDEVSYKIVLLAICCGIQIGLCLINSIVLVYYCSIGGLIALLYSICIILYQFSHRLTYKYTFTYLPLISPEFKIKDFILSYGIITSAFLNQNGLHSMIKSIADLNTRRANKMIYRSIVLLFICYCIIAFIGYYSMPICDGGFPLLYFCNRSTLTSSYMNSWAISGRIAIALSFHLFIPVKWAIVNDTIKWIKPIGKLFTSYRIVFIILILIIMNIIAYFCLYVMLFSLFSGISLVIALLTPIFLYRKLVQKQSALIIIAIVVSVLAILLGIGGSIMGIVNLFTKAAFNRLVIK